MILKTCQFIRRGDLSAVWSLKKGLLIAALAVLCGCVSNEKEQMRLSRMADHIIAEITLDTPGLQSEINQSAGILVVSAETSSIPGIAPTKRAVLLDRRTNTKVGVRVTHLDFLGGEGVEKYHLIMLIRDEEELDKALDGKWAYDRETSMDLWLVYFKPDFGTAIVYDLNTLKIKR